ncbi:MULTISPECIES: acyl-CoA thioesterase [Prochlorococcus]|uniref:acyl-CoA thioesterase n=1 Tax=Prochlorococcus TaxID=1218 RepID=UPI0005338151|nr:MULTISPECIES: thioesterase family protein [Prochlorococcus]KGG13199.1 putative thioesterase [Prochlorococcus sp. MIT 0601]
MLSSDWLHLKRVVRFGETDSAGVVHFYQIFRWCHEAWEESLNRFGVNASEIFPNILDKTHEPLIAIPVVHCSADFWKPLRTGDNIELELLPKTITLGRFQILTKFKRGSEYVAEGLVHHQAINSRTRVSCELSGPIKAWLEASVLD